MTSLPAAAPAGPGTGQDNASPPWRPWNGGHRVLQRSGRAEPGHRPEPRSGSAPPGSTGPARHATALALPPPTPGSPVTAADAAADCNDVRSTHQPLPPGPSTTPSPPRQPPSSQWKDYHPTPTRSNDTTGPAPTTPTSTHDAAHPTAQHTSRNRCCAHPLNPPDVEQSNLRDSCTGRDAGNTTGAHELAQPTWGSPSWPGSIDLGKFVESRPCRPADRFPCLRPSGFPLHGRGRPSRSRRDSLDSAVARFKEKR